MFISSIGLASALALLIVLLVNLKWKISAHLCSIGGMFAFIIGMSYRFSLNPVWLIVALLLISSIVAVARIELEQHTLAQTLTGFAVGFVCLIVPTVFIPI
jgi:membrane-associated phospholipid phosphatase